MIKPTQSTNRVSSVTDYGAAGDATATVVGGTRPRSHRQGRGETGREGDQASHLEEIVVSPREERKFSETYNQPDFNNPLPGRRTARMGPDKENGECLAVGGNSWGENTRANDIGTQ